MAKRARGSVRPGQRRPIDRRPGTAATPTPAAPLARPTGLSDAELARAAELETQILAEERAAEDARNRTRDRSKAPADLTRAMGSLGTPRASGLPNNDAEEYAYVARDVRDIVRIAALLFGILFVLYILIDVTGVFKIG